MSVLLALCAVVSNAASSVLQRHANARQVEAAHGHLARVAGLPRQPAWLAGIGTLIVSFLLQAGALATGQLAEVQPLMALELPVAVLLGSIVVDRRLSGRAWTGILAMTLGTILFLFALRPTAGPSDGPRGRALAVAAGLTGTGAALLTTWAFLAQGARRGALLGVASGIGFALTAAFMSAALSHGVSWGLLLRWPTYLVPITGIASLLLYQLGLQAGSLVAVQPGVTLTDPLVAVVLGVMVLHEGVRTGPWLLPEALGMAALGWGAARLSRETTP